MSYPQGQFYPSDPAFNWQRDYLWSPLSAGSQTDSYRIGYILYNTNYMNQNINTVFDIANLQTGKLVALSSSVDSVTGDLQSVKADTSQIVSLLGGVPQSTVFNSYSARLVRVEEKLNNIGGDGMSIGEAAIFGVLLAVIVAVTWRG